MKVAVVGLWHLGSVTAACLAQAGHQVLAYDANNETIIKLQENQAPVFEPGLENLLLEGKQSGKLVFSNKLDDLQDAAIIWITLDTPVDDNDVANVEFVEREIIKTFAHAQNNALIMISSQLPVGTTHKLQAKCKTLYPEKNMTFAYLPENLRLGKAIDIFMHPDRIVIGLDDQQHKSLLIELLKPFSDKLIWMSIVSAEMTKHAINAFLAVSVTFINELAMLCEVVGASGQEVEMGLKSEERIGPKAYLRPGDAIAGGTLMRDINYLTQLGSQQHRNTYLLSAISESNHYHKQWTCRKLIDLLNNLTGKKVAMLGLTYKAGTDTLRRSTAIETSKWLSDNGADIQAYDPTILELPEEYAQFIDLKSTIKDAIHAADAVVISTEYSQFREITADEFAQHAKQIYVLDPNGFTAKNLKDDVRIKYYTVGVPA